MTQATQTIVERLDPREAIEKIVLAALLPYAEELTRGQRQMLADVIAREAKAEIERLQAALKPNLTVFGDAGFIETVTEDTLTIWQEVERPAYLEVGRNADGRIIGLRIHSREIADEILNSEAT